MNLANPNRAQYNAMLDPSVGGQAVSDAENVALMSQSALRGTRLRNQARQQAGGRPRGYADYFAGVGDTGGVMSAEAGAGLAKVGVRQAQKKRITELFQEDEEAIKALEIDTKHRLAMDLEKMAGTEGIQYSDADLKQMVETAIPNSDFYKTAEGTIDRARYITDVIEAVQSVKKAESTKEFNKKLGVFLEGRKQAMDGGGVGGAQPGEPGYQTSDERMSRFYAEQEGAVRDLGKFGSERVREALDLANLMEAPGLSDQDLQSNRIKRKANELKAEFNEWYHTYNAISTRIGRETAIEQQRGRISEKIQEENQEYHNSIFGLTGDKGFDGPRTKKLAEISLKYGSSVFDPENTEIPLASIEDEDTRNIVSQVRHAQSQEETDHSKYVKKLEGSDTRLGGMLEEGDPTTKIGRGILGEDTTTPPPPPPAPTPPPSGDIFTEAMDDYFGQQ